jgi:hypothetical protein
MIEFEFTEENKKTLIIGFTATLLLGDVPPKVINEALENFEAMVNQHLYLTSFTEAYPESGKWVRNFVELMEKVEGLKDG